MKPYLPVFLCAAAAWAANPDLLTRPWNARWIAAAGAPAYDYGVYHFRRSFDLPAKPARFVVHVTADNRYQLFVNGERVAWGPARGDLYHWRYETVDLAPHLKAGRNVLAAVVWNGGGQGGVAQISLRTGFLLEGDGAAERVAGTGTQWRAMRNPAYTPNPTPPAQMTGYRAVPVNEAVDGALYPWGWEQPGFDDSQWKPAVALTPGQPRDVSDAKNHWMLVPRSIPMMEERPERLARVRRSENAAPPAAFPARAARFTIPANTSARLLLDRDELTTAYPELVVSGGRGARIGLKYAESLWMPGKKVKGNRDVIDGKECFGDEDLFIAEGGRNRLYRPLWWRTFRYLELSVKTAGEPLTIEDLRATYTGYPLARRARFSGGPAELQKVLDVGWRTARLCAHETYMDCPYYEQLQYAGDTRIQALVSLYMAGDARLMRNAIEQLDSSRTAEGATYSRAPSALQQYIPPFSLWWIGMVHDYYRYVDDPAFVRRMLPGVRAVLSFFERYQRPNGSLARLPWWNYVDWRPEWPGGVPKPGADGALAPLDLQLLLAYQWAAELESALGYSAMSQVYKASAEKLAAAIRAQYWSPEARLFADTAARDTFSHHTASMAVLGGLVKGPEAAGMLAHALARPGITTTSIYFRYYLHLAMREAGLGDRYLDMLGTWHDILKDGLTTWQETEGAQVRSDCHAWGSSPNIELFRIVLGIDSAAPGFKRVRVTPHPGKLAVVSGAMPHSKGEISVRLAQSGGKLDAEVDLPPGVDGELVWKMARAPLKAGANRLTLRAQ